MSIQNISMFGGGMSEKGNTSSDFSFLGIGKKGQVVQGKITKVANHISINFNGTEVTVAKGTVKEAKEGDVRSFQITDVSKDSIVLKEVGQSSETEAIRGRVSTSVAPSGYSFAECLEASADIEQAKEEANESLSVLSGEDYEDIENEEGSISKTTKECVERAVERIKAKKEWKAQRQQEASELRKELQEGLEKQQATGFLSQKSEAQIKNMLQEAGIPVTSDTFAKVVAALGMSQAALDITDQSKIYIMKQDLAPTIDNLYQGKYSAAVSNAEAGSIENLEEYQQQIERILTECGRADETGRQNAKWLFGNELPINEVTLEKLDVLNQISEKMTPDKVLEQIIFAMTAGLSPKDAVLDDREFVIARDAILDFQNIDDQAIHCAADQIVRAQKEQAQENTGQGQSKGSRQEIVINLEFLRQAQQEAATASSKESTAIPVVYTDGMTEADILKITMKRQLEEIRQKMTLQSAVAMEQKGIHIETEPLERIIDSLREMENAYYSAQIGQGTATVEEEQLDLLQESLGKTMDIANSHAALLGTRVRQQALLTVNELHAAASSQTANRSEWKGVVETVGTQVRTDLGDSIQKAFEGIPALLDEIGLEDTQANERAVRILGYNGMELTEENIEQVKLFDAKVNRGIDNMKPAVVLELIRRGKNPLELPLDELNQELEEIQAEKEISSEERYSRFLWQMEKSGQMTQEERMGYIGVYRLLNQLQKTDGAVIGAVMESKQELTLGNLLTQARTRKGKGVDSVVDDATGMNEGRKAGNSITDQINAGFSNNSVAREQSNDTVAQDKTEIKSRQQDYYQHLVQEALSEVTPSKLQEMTDGEMERLLDVSLEKFCEDLKQTSGKTEIKKEYFEEQAKQIRETLVSGESAQEYLAKLQIPATIENLLAAADVLKENFSTYRESYGRRNVLSKERQEEFKEAVDSIEESVGEEENLTAQCEKAEKIMSEILTKSYEQADISFEDLSKLRKLGQGIHLEGALRRSKSYDIPIRTGDTITSLNLTLIHGSEESGKIQISMEDEKFGHISMDVKVSGKQVKGLVLCDQRQGFEALQAQKESLTTDLEYAGYQIKNISYGMDFKERNELLDEQVQNQEMDTAQLYQVAKILVRYASAVVRAE